MCKIKTLVIQSHTLKGYDVESLQIINKQCDVLLIDETPRALLSSLRYDAKEPSE